MRNLRKPTRGQKKMMSAAGLDWTNWLVLKEDSESIALVSKKSGRKRILLKG